MTEEKALRSVFTYADDGHALAVSITTDGDIVVSLDGDLVAHSHPPDAMASYRAIISLVTREGLSVDLAAPGRLGGGFG